MEQVPTTKIDNAQPAGLRMGGDAAESGSRSGNAVAADDALRHAGSAGGCGGVAGCGRRGARRHARLEKGADGVSKLVVDDPFDRAWRRVGLALDRTGFTVVDRDRSNGLYFVRYSDPDADMARKDREKGFLSKLMVLEDGREGEAGAVPDQGRRRPTPQSTVTVQDPTGAPDRTQASERILALLTDQLK